MSRTVGIRFKQAGKIFYYDAGDLELEVNNYVVVDTAHGHAVGRVIIAPDQVIANESSSVDDMKPVLRLATQEDFERDEEMKQKAEDDLRRAKTKVSEQDLPMNIASAEYDLDGTQFTAYFTATERVDFRNLVRDLSRETGARVQLLQVGDRDRAKLTDGVDICGERLCCSSWMTNFPSVSIRMAKEQDLPLNPQKISGVCGRLYCCLTFEYEDYKALRGTLPKVGSLLSTPAGEARVTGIDFNREVVKLWLTEAHQQVEVAAIDFQLQHGVTVRPMDLVLKIEGPLRPITEASEATPGAGGRPREQREPREQQPRRDRRGRPARDASSAPPRARPPAPPPVQRPAQPPVESTTGATEGEGDAQRRRRRRRRRGRGRGGAGPEGGAPTEPAGD
jgi:cell fate regulator YaaT (PSP1 superfamily)